MLFQQLIDLFFFGVCHYKVIVFMLPCLYMVRVEYAVSALVLVTQCVHRVWLVLLPMIDIHHNCRYLSVLAFRNCGFFDLTRIQLLGRRV